MYEDFADPELEYQKDPNLKKDDVGQLVEWIKKQNHLPKPSEMKLIQFLHSNYYNIEASKRAIENYYTTRAHCPEFFLERNPKDAHIRTALNTSLITILPVRTKEDYPILLTKITDIIPEKFDINEAFKLIDMLISVVQMQIGTSPGQVMVMDAKDFTLGHLLRCNISSLRKFMFFVQEAIPVRLKTLHIVNISSVTEKFSSLVKPFLKKSSYQTYFHKSAEELDGFIPKAALPVEMGGTAGTCQELKEITLNNLLDHYQYFVDEEKEIADESKRIGSATASPEIFGVQGNFKKLEID